MAADQNGLKARFDGYVARGRRYIEEERFDDAMLVFRKAQQIMPDNEKFNAKVAKLQKYLDERCDSNDEPSHMMEIGPGFSVHESIGQKLYAHQREGVRWLWEIHRTTSGAILGDDMGLGKTVQVIAFLSGLFDAGEIRTVLLCMPMSLIATWREEFRKWTPGVNVYEFVGPNKNTRQRELSRAQRRGGVLLTTYDLVRVNFESIGVTESGSEFVWDYIILDEGHRIKNHTTKTAKALMALQARHKLVLTGTALMNRVNELWALFNWTHNGGLLGTIRTFHSEYGNAIERGRQKDATQHERKYGDLIAENLHLRIKAYFLRRTKADVNAAQKSADVNELSRHLSRLSVQPADGDVLRMPKMSTKLDLVVWVRLSAQQQTLYRSYLSMVDVKALARSTRSPLVQLTNLKKICDHLRMLAGGVETAAEDDDEDGDAEAANQNQLHRARLAALLPDAAAPISELPLDTLLAESAKLVFIDQLLRSLHAPAAAASAAHRTLVFSQSVRMLNIIERLLRERDYRFLRMDGSVKLPDRERLIQQWQNSRSTFTVFLLTTQVGGVGLTLTAADRVIIVDPSWNPATDNQAVDRAYRIGQSRDVVVYRLITCGTVEEKIYRRQVFKDAIVRQTTGEQKNPFRYFSRQELMELFVLDDFGTSATQQQLAKLHADQRDLKADLVEHRRELARIAGVCGLSDHHLLYSRNKTQCGDSDNSGADFADEQAHAQLQSRVASAARRMDLESNRAANGQPSERPSRPPAPAPFRSPQVDVFIPKPSDSQRHMLNRPTPASVQQRSSPTHQPPLPPSSSSAPRPILPAPPQPLPTPPLRPAQPPPPRPSQWPSVAPPLVHPVTSLANLPPAPNALDLERTLDWDPFDNDTSLLSSTKLVMPQSPSSKGRSETRYSTASVGGDEGASAVRAQEGQQANGLLEAPSSQRPASGAALPGGGASLTASAVTANSSIPAARFSPPSPPARSATVSPPHPDPLLHDSSTSTAQSTNSIGNRSEKSPSNGDSRSSVVERSAEQRPIENGLTPGQANRTDSGKKRRSVALPPPMRDESDTEEPPDEQLSAAAETPHNHHLVQQLPTVRESSSSANDSSVIVTNKRNRRKVIDSDDERDASAAGDADSDDAGSDSDASENSDVDRSESTCHSDSDE